MNIYTKHILDTKYQIYKQFAQAQQTIRKFTKHSGKPLETYVKRGFDTRYNDLYDEDHHNWYADQQLSRVIHCHRIEMCYRLFLAFKKTLCFKDTQITHATSYFH